MAQAFDTLAAADSIEASGLSRETARAIAEAIKSGQGDLVTKADLKAELAAIETRLTLRTATMLGIYTAVVAGLPKFLP